MPPALKRNFGLNSSIVDAIAFFVALIGMVILMLTAGPVPEGYPEVEIYSMGWWASFALLLAAVILFWTSHFYLEVEYTPDP
jgi:hypothetical protein